ncbi:HAMP domain-containing histidine kinase [Devosia sp. MC532]|uniref:ATP-binding protein n=1 Tax=Devosia sp. MC532 TaxID=2799788 RepID=UPI0018F2C407|nr:HAMP domain-containing histidine kinase [Devosia sp. MC532]
MLRKGSIAASLFIFSAIWLVVALVATGFLLGELYSRSQDRTLAEQVDFNVEGLTAALLEAGDPSDLGIALADPRFGRPRSGWYWIIRNDEGELVNLSDSVVGIDLPELSNPLDIMGRRSAVVEDAFGTKLRVIERAVYLNQERYFIAVSGNLTQILEQVGIFRYQAFIVLGAVGAMLAIMSAVIARFALRPISRLSEAVEAVREGDSPEISGTYPVEIAPLAEEVNALLRSNTQIIERARSQVGNLAHGLKTPIAVLRNEAGSDKSPLAQVVTAEIEKMGTMVSTYLDRARLAARTSVVGKKSDAKLALERLCRVMDKIHRDTTVTLDPIDPKLPWFRGDEQDFEEMAGNLIDNACKWSNGEVLVKFLAERKDRTIQLLLTIDDNGPGLSAEEAEKVLRRGVRLDEKTPGSGLGLDIVKELVDVYGGSLDLKRSTLGGLLVELRLPSARLGSVTRQNAG